MYLVGAGPGDPSLITIRGKQLLERAEVVIYDYLASKKLLNHVPRDAEFIYAGKRGGVKHTHTQEEINQMLIDRARSGRRVIRLKGGDPFIFGRGGEEGYFGDRGGNICRYTHHPQTIYLHRGLCHRP